MAFPNWTEEHNQLREMVRQFVDTELAPYAEEWDRAEKYPARSVIKKMGELGLLGIRFDEEYGGMGLDWWYTAAYVEALGRARNAGVIMSILVDTDMATPIVNELGTPEQKEEFLRPLIAGDKIAALGVTGARCRV